MRTQVLNEAQSVTPWLEFYPPGSSRPERSPLTSSPFTIGRSQAVDLTIDSTRVSREHAVIRQEADGLFIKDLGSTNGTFVNGNRITEARLQDGDVVVFADVEFNFRAVTAGPEAGNVTQVMFSSEAGSTDNAASSSDPLWDLILAVRRRHEVLTHRSIECLFRPIVDLREQVVFGYGVAESDEEGPQFSTPADRQLRAVECRSTERVHDLSRRVAAEQGARLPGELHLFFRLEPPEIGADWVPMSLVWLREVVSERHQIVVEIPDSAVCDIPYFRRFTQQLHELRVLTAYDGFAGGQAQIADLREIPPDFLKLAPSLVRGIDRSSGGQRQIQLIVRCCQEIGCQVVATDVESGAERQMFHDLGCRFAQGKLFGSPCTLEATLRQPNAGL